VYSHGRAGGERNGGHHDTDPEYFDARVRNMDSERHLRAALDVEVARDNPRPDRVGLLNQRLAEISDDQN